MNKDRKKRLNNINETLTELTDKLNDVVEEEEGAYESLPENLQQSERAEAMQDTISTLQDCVEDLGIIISNIEDIINT